MADVHDLLNRLFALSLAVAEHTARGLEQRGLNRSEARLLWALADDGPLTQQRLSTLLDVTPRYVTRLVDKLQESGLVERQSHPTDRRSVHVVLSATGTRLLRRMRGEHARLAEDLFADLTHDQRVVFDAVADHLLGRLTSQ